VAQALLPVRRKGIVERRQPSPAGFGFSVHVRSRCDSGDPGDGIPLSIPRSKGLTHRTPIWRALVPRQARFIPFWRSFEYCPGSGPANCQLLICQLLCFQRSLPDANDTWSPFWRFTKIFPILPPYIRLCQRELVHRPKNLKPLVEDNDTAVRIQACVAPALLPVRIGSVHWTAAVLACTPYLAVATAPRAETVISA